MVIWDGHASPFPLVLRTLTNMKWNNQRWVRVTAEDHLFLRLDAPDDTSVDAGRTERNAWGHSHAGGFCGAGGNARRNPEADDVRDPFPLTHESQETYKQSNQLATHDNASFRQRDRESSHLTGREQEKHQAGGPATASHNPSPGALRFARYVGTLLSVPTELRCPRSCRGGPRDATG